MSIAGRVITIVGGAEMAAEITGVSVSQVHRWKWSKDRGGTGGLIPAQHQQPLLDFARANDLPLTPDDFFEPHGEEDVVVASAAPVESEPVNQGSARRRRNSWQKAAV